MENSNQAVRKFSIEGETLFLTASLSTAMWGIAVDKKGRIVVTTNACLLFLSPEGLLLEMTGLELCEPKHLVIDDDGDIITVGDTHRVTIFG